MYPREAPPHNLLEKRQVDLTGVTARKFASDSSRVSERDPSSIFGIEQ